MFGLHRYLYHSSSNPDAAFQSAKILRRIARYPNIQARLVGDFTHDQVRDITLSIGNKINKLNVLLLNVKELFCNEQAVSEKLMAGFVECLDSEEAQEGVSTDGESLISKWPNVIYELFKAEPSTSFFFFVQTQILRNGWPGFDMKPRSTS